VNRKSPITFAIAMFLLAISMSAFADAAPAPASSSVVNINTADASQLSLLPRVGAKAAQRIIDYRTQHGPFKKTSDLMQVKGFGDKSFKALSAHISVDGKTSLTSKVSSPRKPRKASKQPSTTASK
jgi:competence protein ComEA